MFLVANAVSRHAHLRRFIIEAWSHGPFYRGIALSCFILSAMYAENRNDRWAWPVSYTDTVLCHFMYILLSNRLYKVSPCANVVNVIINQQQHFDQDPCGILLNLSVSFSQQCHLANLGVIFRQDFLTWLWWHFRTAISWIYRHINRNRIHVLRCRFCRQANYLRLYFTPLDMRYWIWSKRGSVRHPCIAEVVTCKMCSLLWYSKLYNLKR